MEKELMGKEIIMIDIEASSKEEIIDIMAEALQLDGRVSDKDSYIQDIMRRENVSSTAIGFKIATPHAKSAHIRVESLSFARLKNPIKWDNEEMVQMVFMIGVPSLGQGDRHLELLSDLFRKLVKKDFREQLENVTSAEEFKELIGIVL